MPSRLEFNPGNHTYKLDGHRVPGVTTAIKRNEEKGGLAPAAAKLTALYAAENPAPQGAAARAKWVDEAKAHYRMVWNAQRDKGIFLHDAARQLIDGTPLRPADADGVAWPDDVIASAKQLARFMDDFNAQPILAERPVFHDVHFWAGTLDLVALLNDGKRWLLDYKTGKGIYPSMALQAAAYRHATHVQILTESGDLIDRPMVAVDRAGVIHIQDDGYQLIPIRSDDLVYRRFLHTLPLADFWSWKPSATVGDPIRAEK